MGPEDGVEVDVHADGTFNVARTDAEYMTAQWNNGGTDGRGETSSYGS